MWIFILRVISCTRYCWPQVLNEPILMPKTVHFILSWLWFPKFCVNSFSLSSLSLKLPALSVYSPLQARKPFIISNHTSFQFSSVPLRILSGFSRSPAWAEIRGASQIDGYFRALRASWRFGHFLVRSVYKPFRCDGIFIIWACPADFSGHTSSLTDLIWSLKDTWEK